MSVPNSPTQPVAIALNASALLYWSAPVGPVQFYKITTTPFSQIVYTPVPITYVYSLENNVPITFEIVAINEFGESIPTFVSITLPKPNTRPDPPFQVTSIAGDASAFVSWSSPVNNGGYPILSYKVISYPDFQVVITSDLSVMVPNLRNNIAYQFYVYATNFLGDSRVSIGSLPVIPRSQAKPDAPIFVTSVAGNASAFVSWTAPLSEGAAPITSYRVFSYPDFQTATTPNLSTFIFSLRNNISYQFYVYATNYWGDSNVSEGSFPVIPRAKTRPDPPIKVKTVWKNSNYTISWSPPLNDGGYPIAQYKVVYIQEKKSVIVRGTTTATFYHLQENSFPLFYVMAMNLLGYSRASEITPDYPPDPPTHLSTTLGNNSCAVYWTPPLYHGRSPIQSYHLILSSTALSDNIVMDVAASQTSYIFYNLSPFVSYNVSIQTVNKTNISLPATIAFTSASVPLAPQNLQLVQQAMTPTTSTVLLSWDAAYTLSDYPILYYTIYTEPFLSPMRVNGKELQVILEGLSSLISYLFYVSATNFFGESPLSMASVPSNIYRNYHPILYKKLTTGGNDPSGSKKMRYSSYIKSSFRSALINYDGGTFI